MTIARYAVMGNPIAHSLSPGIHQHFAEQQNRVLCYDKCLIEEPFFEAEVHAFFNAGGRGLNITQPFKERAFQLSTHQTPRCQQARAANTLWMTKEGLWADNTDGVGLLRDLKRHAVELAGARLLMIGAGGAARGVLGPLLAADAHITVVNRTHEKAIALQRDFQGAIDVCTFDTINPAYDVVIHATSAHRQKGPLPFPRHWLQGLPFCYDLAYGDTPFVAWAKMAGCEARDGFGMLVEQAAEAHFMWHGVRPDTTGLLMP